MPDQHSPPSEPTASGGLLLDRGPRVCLDSLVGSDTASSPEPQASTGSFTPGPVVHLLPGGNVRITLQSPDGDEMAQVVPLADVIALTRMLATWRYITPHLPFFAAAPDLYAALEEIANNKGAKPPVDASECRAIARAALAKARGES